MKGIRNLVLLLLAVSPVVCLAQAQTVWSQLAYGAGGQNLEWTDVITLPSGKVAACGTEETPNGKNLVIQAWDPSGSVAWIYRYPDPLDVTLEYGGKLAVRGNNLLCVGHRYFDATATQTNIYLVELTDLGSQVHIHNYSIDFVGNSDIEEAVTVVGTDAYITGRNENIASDSYFVLKVDSLNNISWIYNPAGAGDVSPLKAEVLPNGGIACGYMTGALSTQTHLLILNPLSGTLAYSYVPPTSSSDEAQFAVTNLGNISLTYRHTNGSTVRIEQLNSNLGSFGGTDIPGTVSHLQLCYSPTDNSLYHLRYNYPVNSFFLRKYNSGGTLAWEDTVSNTIQSPNRFWLKVDRYGNPLAVASHEVSATNLNLKAWCWDAFGNRQWSNSLEGTNNSIDTPNSFAVDDTLRLYVVGRAENNTGSLWKGAMWRTSQAFSSTPSYLNVVAGQTLSGTMDSVKTDDGIALSVRRRLDRGRNLEPIIIEFESTFPIGNARPGETTLTFKVKSKANSGRLVQAMQMWNYTTQTWGESNLLKLPASFTTISLSPSNVGDYFDPITRRVRARILVNPGLANSGTQFSADIDYVEWSSNT